MGFRKLLLMGVSVLAMVLVAVPAMTTLSIESPVSTSITVEQQGSSPTFAILDNTDDTSEGRAASITNDVLAIDFDGIVPSRSQVVTIGSSSEPVFTLKNNYSCDLSIALAEVASTANFPGGASGVSATEVSAVDHNDMKIDLIDTSGSTMYAIEADVTNVGSGNEAWELAVTGSTSLASGNTAPYYLKITTDPDTTGGVTIPSGIAFDFVLKFVASGS